jgi:hypothetical protein
MAVWTNNSITVGGISGNAWCNSHWLMVLFRFFSADDSGDELEFIQHSQSGWGWCSMGFMDASIWNAPEYQQHRSSLR